MTRLVVIDAALLALLTTYIIWAARTKGRVPLKKLFSGPRPVGRARWVGLAVLVVAGVGLTFLANRYSLRTASVNSLVIVAVVAVMRVVVQAVHNRALDRR